MSGLSHSLIWSTSDRQRLAESILGPVDWQGAEGYCRCPGEQHHTKPTTERDLHVIVEPLPDGVKPGAYCWHESCSGILEEVNRRLRSELGKGYSSGIPRAFQPLPVRPPKPTFDPVALERIASRLSVDDAFFAVRSAKKVDSRTPASFLRELYADGEKIIVFDVYDSQGQAVWERKPVPFDATELDRFRRGKKRGVWYLSAPVTGDYVDTGRKNPDGSPKTSRRSWKTVTAFRYLVVESDKANPAHWLSALAQMPLPVVAVYTSGGKSTHALVRIGAASKPEWDDRVAVIKASLIKMGADPKTMSAVRLSRLPCCERLGTDDAEGQYIPYPNPQIQRLLYLDGSADDTPICERSVR
jgi:hypothetical protein